MNKELLIQARDRQCHTCKYSDSWGQPDCTITARNNCGVEKKCWEPLNQPTPERIKPTNIEPGSREYFSMLGVEFGYNFLMGEEFRQLQAYSKKVWDAALQAAIDAPEPEPIGAKLYTHPAPAKQLTDAEIAKIEGTCWGYKAFSGDDDLYFDHARFARAIEAAHGIGTKS